MSRRLPPWAVTAVGAVAWLIADPPTPDLVAHLYRAEIVREAGLGVWEQGWYAGHHLPGYSVLMPPLAALTTPQLVAALAAVASTWCFTALARSHWGAQAAGAAALWFALAALSPLVGGQLAFAAGMAPALGALLAGARDRRALAGGLAAATTLTSPVAAAFLLLAVAAWWLAARPRAAVWVAAGAIAPGALILVAFPQGGTQPFAFSSFAWSLAVALVLLVVAGRREAALRWGAALYALVLVTGVTLDTPLGGNLVRLAAVFAGPLAAGALWPERRLLLALLAVPLLYWQWLAPVRSVIRASGDPAAHAAFHAPLIAELDRRATREGPMRIEVPFTANHWETRYLPLRHPIARGWERQLDVRDNPIFYDAGALTPTRYRRWLDDLAVRYVALAATRPDPAGRDEARLVRSGAVPGLREVWHGGAWRLFEVQRARPLASAPLRVTRLGVDEVALSGSRAGTVRVRFTPYWKLVEGAGCVSRAPDGWTRVRLDRPGGARLAVRFSLARIGADGPRCTR